MKKKLLAALLAAACAVTCAFGISACSNTDDNSGSGDNNLNGEITKPSEEVVSGKFYTLQEAYDNGFLIQDDLESIAFYHNGEKNCSESLNEDVIKSVKREWAKKLAESENNPTLNITEDMVVIRKYYGTYNECHAMILERIGVVYPAAYAPYTVVVGDVTFNYVYPRPQIIIYKV